MIFCLHFKNGKAFAVKGANKNCNMKMKTLALSAIVFLGFTYSSNAQSAIIRGGVNLANVSVTDNGRVDDANSLTSFQVGIIGDVQLGGPVYLQPGILFTGKGSKVQSGDASSYPYYKATSNPKYIEVPVNVVLKAPIGPSAKFFAGAGPYIAVGVAGKNKTEGKNIVGVGFAHENEIEFSNDDPTTLNYEEGAGLGIIKRFDYGLNGTAGIESKSVVLSVNYGLGLAKLQSGGNSSADNNNKHRVLSFTVGIRL
jgi:hypothetical protein